MAGIISTKDFFEQTRCLLEMPISYAWRGFSTAIFLELGVLKDEGNHPKGNASVGLEFDWRVEKLESIFFSSGSGKRKINNGLQKLVNSKIVEVETEGRLPKLILTLSSNLWVRSFTIYESQPQWTLFLTDGNCLSTNRGKIMIESCNRAKQK